MISDEDLERLKRHAQEGPEQSVVKRWRILELIEEVEQARRPTLIGPPVVPPILPQEGGLP